MIKVSGPRLCKALERNGWSLLRIHGSHNIYGKDGPIARISVPVHGAKPLKVGLLSHLLKLSGLYEATFNVSLDFCLSAYGSHLINLD